MMRTARTEVVIAGAGPVGLLLAAELAGQGVRTVVFDPRLTTATRPKATTLHARTLQCLARRGYHPAPRLPLRTGSVSSPFHFAGVPGLDITAPASEPAPILKRPQAEIEQQFEARARTAGARVLRGHRVIALEQEPAGVRVVAEGPAGRTEYRAAYAVGADGARSTVRELAGLPGDTVPATVSALMGRVRIPRAEALEPGWHRTPRGWVVAKQAEDGATHLRTLDCSRPPADRRLPLELPELRRETSRIMGRDITMTDPRWLSRFSDFSRLARSYRSGRVLLAGDAAHVHFPVGGQGLSTGLLDALNLGWKLAMTVRGIAGAGLLDSYDAERRPAAARVIDNVRTQVALMHPDRAPSSLDELATGPRSGHPARLALALSAQDTVLPTRSAHPSPQEGQFMPNVPLTPRSGPTDVIRLLRGGRMVLLRFGPERGFGGAGLEAFQDLRTVQCAPVPERSFPSLVLMRPDGYVAWSGSSTEGLERALPAWIARTADATRIASRTPPAGIPC